ncbi:MAG: sodium:solute symporter, partial [Lentisphaerae bacterium]
MNTATIANLCVVVLYLLAMAGMGVYFMKRNSNTEAYFLGGRRIPGWALGISMVGNAISSITFLALPAAAYVL